MKKAILSLLVMAAGSAGLSAQTTSARVSYDQVMHMNIQLSDDAGSDLTDLLPKEAHMPYVLNFDQRAAVYRADKSKPVESRGGAAGDGERLEIHIQTPDEVFYTDLQTGKVTQQKDLMGRKFLVADTVEKMSWRLTGRQKTIIGYSCQEALCVHGKDTISAWYTGQIPVSAGPMDWHGLPGLILEGAMGSGDVSITVTATKVDAVQPDASALAVPKEGKKVSRKEFAAIEEKKRKEMQQENGGQGNVIIRIE